MAEEDVMERRTETSILDLPSEVLSHIIVLLTARERVPLGNSCQRLRALVFEDPHLLRYLDFSKKSRPDDNGTYPAILQQRKCVSTYTQN